MKQKASILIELKASNVTNGFDLGHDLINLEFSRSNMEFAISQPKMVRLPWNKKQTYWLKSRPQMWPMGLTLAMTLTLNLQGQIWDLLYLTQKWSDCHEIKSKYIDWTLGLKCDHEVWHWPWVWPWILRSNMILTFDHTLGLDQGFSLSNFEIAASQNGRTDWHWTKGVWVGHSWPWLWPFGEQGQV